MVAGGSMKIKIYIATVQHDQGIIKIAVPARNKKVARELIMAAEHCPSRAIKEVV
jgi:flavoprotein